MLFDTHMHIIDLSRFSYPWVDDEPRLQRDWSYEDFAAQAARLGISDVLHMECAVSGGRFDAETAFVAGIMARPGSLIRGLVSAAAPESDGFERWLAEADLAVIKGVRRVLIGLPDDVIRSDLFCDNIARLGRAGLPFDICAWGPQLPLAIELVDAAPGTIFVLDHCGMPDIEHGAFGPWAENIRELARRPHVNGKISGITTRGGPGWTVEALRPYVEHMVDCFGWDRLVWGSDHPVTELHASLSQWVAATHALMSGASESERGKLFQGNARRVWRV